MSSKTKSLASKMIFTAQIGSLSLIWIFVIGVAIWIINLVAVSVDLDDVPGVSLGISFIAIPVFITLASILTFVFIGFQRKNNHKSNNKIAGD